METMNIAIPEALKEFVQQRVSNGGYSSASEYIRELIRLDQRQSAKAVLEAELLRGLASGPPVEMTKQDWADIRQEARKRISSRKKR
jgi:antitoxin ParD1/3/4